MTKSREHGENETTDEAKREAARTGIDICAVLAEMLKSAQVAGDTDRIRKIIQAQKYMGCRNIRRRRQKQ
jgi:hypothetical protein